MESSPNQHLAPMKPSRADVILRLIDDCLAEFAAEHRAQDARLLYEQMALDGMTYAAQHRYDESEALEQADPRSTGGDISLS